MSKQEEIADIAMWLKRPTSPNQWHGIDMAKAMFDGFGWRYVVIVID